MLGDPSRDFNNRSRDLFEGVAKHPNTSTETLDTLFDSTAWMGESSFYVSRVIAENPKTSTRTIDKIMEKLPECSEYAAFREYRRETLNPIIRHKNTSSEKLGILAEDKDPIVKRNARKKLAERANQSIDLSKLSPELREQVKGMSPKEIGKFLGWLRRRKSGSGSAPVEENESESDDRELC